MYKQPLSTGNGQQTTHSAAWYTLFLLFLAYAVAWLDRQILTLLIPAIKQDLHLSDTQISLLQGFAFSLLYAVAGIPLAHLADRQSRRRIIAVGMLLWSAFTVCCGLARNFWQLFGARMGVGIGEAALAPSAYSMIANLFPPRLHATAYALFQMGSTIGGGLAMILGGALIAWLAHLDISALPIAMERWQLAFVVVGVPGIALGVLFITATEPVRRVATRAANDDSVFRYLRANADRYTCLFLAVALLGLLSIGTAAWYPTFLMRLHHFSAAQAGYCYGLILLSAGSLGVLAGGYLSDALIRRGIAHANIRIMQYSTGLKLIPLIIGPLLSDIRGVIAMLALATFIGQFSSGVAVACLQAICPDRYRARISAVMLLVVNLLALGLGATYVAVITDYVFADEFAIHYSLALTAATVGPLILALLWWYRRITTAASMDGPAVPVAS